MSRNRWARRTVNVLGVLTLASGLLAGCGDDDDSGGTAASTTATTASTTTEAPTTTAATSTGIEIGAGLNDPEDSTIAVLQFIPAKVTVPVDTPVTWQWSGSEPHSVTFLAPGEELPPPGSDPTWFAPKPSTGDYDGSTTVSSGLQPLGTPAEPFTLSFAEEGTFEYYCVIHPQMIGTLDVVPAGEQGDTPADIASQGETEAAEWLAEGRAAKKALTDAEVTSTPNGDGSSTFQIQMGASTPNTDVLAFQPVPAEVAAGDSVTFVNNSTAPHTASFFGAGSTPIQNPTDPRVGAPAPGPSPQDLSASGFFNTGLLPPDAPPGAGPPESARSFTFKVPSAGTFAYVCILHAPSNMVGTIVAT